MEGERQVSTEEGQALAQQMGVYFLETSAKDCKNVDDAFIQLSKEIKGRVAAPGVKAQGQDKGEKLKRQTKQVKAAGCCK